MLFSILSFKRALFCVRQVKAYFASDDTGLGLSMGELCTHIIDVLTSSRSDEELQNEVSVHMIRLLALADIRNAH